MLSILVSKVFLQQQKKVTSSGAQLFWTLNDTQATELTWYVLVKESLN